MLFCKQNTENSFALLFTVDPFYNIGLRHIVLYDLNIETFALPGIEEALLTTVVSEIATPKAMVLISNILQKSNKCIIMHQKQ